MGIGSKARRIILGVAVAVLSFAPTVRSQTQASNYFPPAFPFLWNYQEAVLDTLQVPVDSLSTSREVTWTSGNVLFEGMDARMLSGRRSDGNVPGIPDTQYVSLNGSVASQYFRSLPGAGTGTSVDTLALAEIMKALRGWYDVYRFASTLGLSYTLVSKDTTLTINAASVPLRFAVEGKRLADQTVTVPAGTFTAAKRFVLSFKVYLMYLPVFPVQVVALDDSTWIGSFRWIVREVIPSRKIDLSLLGLGTVWLLGKKTELHHISITPAVRDPFELPVSTEIRLDAYPNPFNPATMIRMHLPASTNFGLEAYDVSGRLMGTIAVGYRQAGDHEIPWDAGSLPSGVYYIRLTTPSGSTVRPVQLLK